ncbi:C-3 sterol dehydrogenase [Flagelloscypha sp. PMI_526]|nr:C-3 sterol dehydrogenase [Flagelloscypha sp. PMI_526]
MSSRDIFLVIGGSGFLGRHIVEQLKERGDSVTVFDVVQRYHDTPFYSGDLCDQELVSDVLRKSGTTCIIHCASPHGESNDPGLFFRVNVEGTKAVIAAAVQAGVKKLVYTSSAGVLYSGEDLMDVDERTPYPTKSFDAYNESKAKGEQAVLEANGKSGLYTVALRPAGIFGPGDRQALKGFHDAFMDNKTGVQIGNNTNLTDWTYVGNVAYAHLLAAAEEPPSLTQKEIELIETRLSPVSLTTGTNKIPTSASRPLGPYVTPNPNAAQLEHNWKSEPNTPSSHPISRTKFDQMSFPGLSTAKLYNPEVSPLQVAGQAFFITNGEPIYFWDFARLIWSYLFEWFPEKKHKQTAAPWVLSKDTGMMIASLLETAGWLTGKKTVLTRFRVSFCCSTRWHNIEKARRVLGYEPQVGVEEGVRRMMEWWKTEVLDTKTQ